MGSVIAFFIGIIAGAIEGVIMTVVACMDPDDDRNHDDWGGFDDYEN